jgi:PAS domain-containing protein
MQDAEARLVLWRPDDVLREACRRTVRKKLDIVEWEHFLRGQPYRRDLRRLLTPDIIDADVRKGPRAVDIAAHGVDDDSRLEAHRTTDSERAVPAPRHRSARDGGNIAILTPAVEAEGPRIAFVNDAFCAIYGRRSETSSGRRRRSSASSSGSRRSSTR